MLSFDVQNMYTNIPKTGTTDIITNILKFNAGISENNQKEIAHILETVMKQNYFQFRQKYYEQAGEQTGCSNISNIS
jgi:hypothetical protein